MKIICVMPAAAASSTAYWINGLSTIGSISFGIALVAGRKRVPRPATGNTALRTGFMSGCSAMSEAMLTNGQDAASTMTGMSTFAIGDLQGCLASFEALQAQLPDARRLIFVGDLVNRGPQSLATLRAVRALVESGRAVALLGNHDLHLLAVDAGIRPLHDSDTLQEILDAPDRVR